MSHLTKDLKEYAYSQGADLCGIARAEDLNETFTPPHRPIDLLPDVKTIVVASLHIPDGALEAQRAGITNYSYNMFGYAYLNREMDFVAYRITRFLERQGYQALPIPARGMHYWEKKKYHGPFSFRHAAVAAGLGTFGWSGIVLTPEFGSRQRFIAVLTDAPLTPDRQREDDDNPCQKCYECVKNCPAGAVTKKPWSCVIGGKTHTYGVVEPDRCYWVCKGLTTKAWPGAPSNPAVDVEKPENMTGEEKFKAIWEKRDARIRLSEHDEGNYGATLCGRCMIFCSAGRTAMERRLKKPKGSASNG
jgi:epoxyqueuosine reductase